MRIFAILTMTMASGSAGSKTQCKGKVINYPGERSVPRMTVLEEMQREMDQDIRAHGAIIFFSAEPEEIKARD